MVAAEVAHLAFYTAFLVSSSRIAELGVESPVRAKRHESFSLTTLVASQDLGNRKGQVVVAHSTKHATEELERLLLRLEERLLRRAGIASMECAPAGHAPYHQRLHLRQLATDPGVRLVPVHLSFIAPRVALRDEHLRMLQAELTLAPSNVPAHRRFAYFVIRVALSQSIPDATRGVTLLAWFVSVGLEDRVDEIPDRAKLRALSWRPLTFRRQRALNRITHHPAVHSELPRYPYYRPNSVFVLPTHLLEQSHFGAPFQPMPPLRAYARSRLSIRCRWAKSNERNGPS